MNVAIQLFKLAPYQEAFLYNTHRFTGVEASTKAGKTAAGIQWGVTQWHDIRFPVGWETTWCAPVYEQSKIAYKRIKRALPKEYDVNDSSLTMFTPRGDELRFKSADNVNNLYGPDARAVVFEEFTRAPHLMDAFIALRSTLTTTRGKMKLIGNFIGSANAGHQLCLAHKDDPEWAHFIITAQMAVDAGIMDREELEQARKDLPHHRFMALYMCEGSVHPLQMMRSDAINSLWTNNHVPEGLPALTVDIARFGRDKTVIGAWSGMRLKHIETIAKNSIPEAVEAINKAAQMFGVQRHRVVVDEGGVGGGVVDALTGCIAFNDASSPMKAGEAVEDHNYHNLRAQCYYRLADIVNAGGIFIDCTDHRDEIALELEVVRRLEDQAENKLKVIKKDEMKTLIGRSPDYGDMIKMRVRLELEPSTQGFERVIDNILENKGKEMHREAVERMFNIIPKANDRDY